MMHLLSSTQAVQTVPLNIVRENGRSQIYLGLPRSLTLGEIKKVMRLCITKSEERGAACQGRLAGVFMQGKVAPRFVVWVSTWGRNEAALCDELLSELPRLLRAPVVPVFRH